LVFFVPFVFLRVLRGFSLNFVRDHLPFDGARLPELGMLAYHRRMLAFDHWANATSLAAVQPVAARAPRSVAWLNHILGAKRIWLARVTATPMPFGLNPTFAMEELAAEFDVARDGWARFLDTQSDADVARAIHYANLKGDPFSSPLGDILAHLPLHGHHHRGQINADLRAAGVTPPAVDFIHAARMGVLP
jgi:uncharacterized damage-inducible protein DinB